MKTNTTINNVQMEGKRFKTFTPLVGGLLENYTENIRLVKPTNMFRLMFKQSKYRPFRIHKTSAEKGYLEINMQNPVFQEIKIKNHDGIREHFSLMIH